MPSTLSGVGSSIPSTYSYTLPTSYTPPTATATSSASGSYTTTSLLLIDNIAISSIDASVVAANSASTTFALTLGSGGSALITVGPAATSGVYDANINTDSVSTDAISLHCTTSNAVPLVCEISTQVQGNAVVTTLTPSSGQYSYYPVTVTAGGELLAKASTASVSGSASTGAVTSASTGAAALPTAWAGHAGGVGGIALLGMVLGRMFA